MPTSVSSKIVPVGWELEFALCTFPLSTLPRRRRASMSSCASAAPNEPRGYQAAVLRELAGQETESRERDSNP